MALTYTPETPQFGSLAPDFQLRGVDDRIYTLKDFTNGEPLLVLFICNHCPYVKAIEDRLIALGHDLKKENMNMIAICSNDPNKYTEDRFEALAERAKEKNYSFIYLHDPEQVTARAYGAVCTPDYFLFDKELKLQYRGRLDDNWKNAELVTKRELYEAALELKYNKQISFKQTPSMGCSIKWIT